MKEGLPKGIQNDVYKAAEGDKKAKKRLSVAGKKGAKVRLDNEAVRQESRGDEIKRICKEEIARLHAMYPEKRGPEGEVLDDDWFEKEAQQYAEAVIAMKDKQKAILKGGR